MSYNHIEIEQKWQSDWEAKATFKVEDFSEKQKFYVLDMFPYPSGSGLHMGHVEGYTASDIVSRFKRMQGFHVLHPMGWDSFGLPTENFAIEQQRHPQDITRENIAQFKGQLKRIGYDYDWGRELATSHREYYRWTQWLFLKLYERGLAYEAEAVVNYCPALKTVLANEEVIDGKSERGGHPVVRLAMQQWILRITEYAERLLEDLEELDWPEHVKEMQRNWIGKSHGVNIAFDIDGRAESLRVFTTRADTLMGVTFMVLAAEHPWVSEIIEKEPEGSELRETVQTILGQSERDRESGQKEKIGQPLPLTARHPITGKPLPIWVSNYVLASYGTGAIMAVPAHDERDKEFAQKFDLPTLEVINDDGVLINSGTFDGLHFKKAQEVIAEELNTKGKGSIETRYRLRDWVFSRQRYWGEPIPILHFEDGTCRSLGPDELPLDLPEVQSYRPSGDGRSPLHQMESWVNIVDKKTGKPAKRETNTMPQWAGSCWYYLRFIDSRNSNAPWDKKKEEYWMPVDLYIGGVEHATLHLLYARFWHKVFYDCGLVTTKEPFKRLVNQGMILGEDNEKMSKSRGNVVNPDDLIQEFGADSLRLYIMFMGPLEVSKPWKSRGILGVNRFLHRLFALVAGTPHVTLTDQSSSQELKRLHLCTQKVSQDTDRLRFNTAIAEMMSFLNFIYDQKAVNKETLETFCRLLCPYAPHICEEIWHRLGFKDSVCLQSWPTFDPKLTAVETVTMAVQVNGKLRGTIEVNKDMPKEDVLSEVAKDIKLKTWLEHKDHVKTIVVPNRVVNIVVRTKS